MFSLLKKESDTTSAPKAPASSGLCEHPDQFIPFAIHYDQDTLLTKNGELVKIIKIINNNFGLNYDNNENEQSSLRAIIRQAIGEAVGSNKYSFWIHTLRRRTPIQYKSTFTGDFENYVNKKWEEKHDWKDQYHNEIYISVLSDGQGAELLDTKHLKDVILPMQNRMHRNAYLEKTRDQLTALTDRILTTIRRYYDANYLKITERTTQTEGATRSTPVFYSESLEFLGVLCNLRAETFPVTHTLMDKALCTHQIIFGYNAVETKNSKGEKKFAGILTLKNLQEVSISSLDKILQFPAEFFISQSFNYVPYAMAQKAYKAQKLIFEMSEDAYSYQKSGLEAKLNPTGNKATAYGTQQATITVLVDDLNQLEGAASRIQQAFSEVGLLAIREDIKLEEAFWAQIPGNFEFLRRQNILVSSNIAPFCRLNLFPSGTASKNHWGDAAALLPTTVNSPYFFNFHHQDNGHTLMLDYNSFGDAISLVHTNFLLTSALKYNPKMYVFDNHQASRLYFDKIKSPYHLFNAGDKQTPATGLNPFSLENTARNQSFLLAWCCALIEPAVEVTDAVREYLRQALAEFFERHDTRKTLFAFAESIRATNNELYLALSQYFDKGQYAGIFDADIESVDYQHRLNGFDIPRQIRTGSLVIPLFSYLMHRIITQLDGRPTIIVLHDALDLLENSFFAPRLESLLEMLRQNNVVVFSRVRATPEAMVAQTLHTLAQISATRIIVPDDVSQDYTSELLGITPTQSRMLKRMDRQKGEFLLRKAHDTIGLRINLEGMDDVHSILAGDIKNLIAAGGLYSSLPEFY